jgi:2-(1,2-epoxy-1,2-dihydrophenyl)acetyl-CoA isomerase
MTLPDPYHSTDDLLITLVDGRLSITLNRPERGNALRPQQRDQLIAILDHAGRDRDVRVITLTATGRHFCTGADLRVEHPDINADDTGKRSGAVMATIQAGAQRLMAGLLDIPKPVIAGVNGTAAGIGVHLALSCDFVVMAEEASFIESFVNIGLGPDGGGAYLLPRLIGLQRAKELVLLGDRLSAAEALRIGLANRVVPASEVVTAVDELAARLAAGPTLAIGMAKRMLNRSLESDRATAFLEESATQEIITNSEDSAEGIASFVEKRPAAFKGY